MPKIIKNGVTYIGTSDNAAAISYDNTSSGLNATDVQGAIDELDEKTGVIGESISMFNRFISTPNNTWTHCSSISIYKGKYLIIGSVAFENNSTGVRCICISSNSTADAGSSQSRVYVNPASGSPTILQTVYYIETTSNSTTLYLNALQKSGGYLTVSDSSITVIRLA